MTAEPNPSGLPRRSFLSTLGTGVGLAALHQAFPFRGAQAQKVQAAAAALEDHRFEDLASTYGLSSGLVYLNHASIGTMPKPVNEARLEYLRVCESNPWWHVWGGAWSEAVDETRARASSYLGCLPEEIALTHNTTEGFGILAHGLPLEPDDEVLFSSLNHIGASACWHHLEARGRARVKTFPFPILEAPQLSAEDIVSIHVREITSKTKVLVIPHIDNLVGIRHPVRRIAQAARERGVEYVAVDGAQAIAMIPVEMDQLDVDFYATSGHKWIQAPKETGIFYVRRSAQERLRPLHVTWGQARWSQDARAFEDYGTRDLSAILALGHALDFQAKLEAKARQARLKALWNHCRERTARHPKLTWRSPSEFARGASLVAIGIDGIPTPELARSLREEHQIIVRPFPTYGLNSLRVSPNLANSLEEIDRFFDAVEKKIA